MTNARFGEQAEFYLNLAMLARQLPWLTPLQHREITDMAFLTALFYGPDLLKSGCGTRAVFNDLTSIHLYRQLEPYKPEVAREALATWERHLDIITAPLVITAMVDTDWSDDQRERMAKTLLELLPQRVWQLPPTRVQYPGPTFCRNQTFWPVDGSLPDLALFVTQHSFLIFNIMEMTDAELQEWWQAPASQWSDDPGSPVYKSGFHKLKEFITKVQWTNDEAER